jgi:hypothetical protein
MCSSHHQQNQNFFYVYEVKDKKSKYTALNKEYQF